MFINGSELNEQSLQKAIQWCFLHSLASFGKAVSEKICLEINQSETELPLVAMFANGSELNEQSL